MHPRTSVLVAMALTAAVVAAAGCGGSSLDHGDGGGPDTGGRAAGAGGAAAGGAPAMGGALPAAGGALPTMGGAPTNGGYPAAGGWLDGFGGFWDTGGYPPITGGTTSTGGRTGTGGAPEICGAPFRSACPESGFCAIPLVCAGSSLQTFSVDCNAIGYKLVDVPCSRPYEHCSASSSPFAFNTYCEGGHFVLHGVEGEPPRPCGVNPPVVGSPCLGSEYEQSFDDCGYECGPTTRRAGAWTVFHCTPSFDYDAGTATGPRTWQSDGACERTTPGSDAGAN